MNREFAKVIKSDAVQKWLATEGMVAAGGPPEQFRERIKADVEQWKRVRQGSEHRHSQVSGARPSAFGPRRGPEQRETFHGFPP